ncbi:MAG: nucleoside-diphosphate kinase [Propionibacterium sp.]|uniref:Nucleoside diphosphate kinase n=1 Tax=Brooklawnia propionicigenes TaxID=3041175 RepID=A0AAN0MHX1_9ACTN|nr:nucleoside-diphosphate kinase [Brooklawnia sp. SH051]NLI86144.1 nucleoside-diphosphate kinase [Propionibacterium sp.]BEH03178.1 nucleoside-diphosphate kinase [Brooklawnia sp. SH051]
MSAIDRTLVLVKPDGVARGLIGQIIARYEAKGLTIRALELRQADAALAAQHYVEHVGRDYYPSLEAFITSGPLVAMVLEGERAIDAVRTLNGVTDSAVAAPGTIRGDFSLYKNRNLVHASDAPDSAAREIGLWFPALEV